MNYGYCPIRDHSQPLRRDETVKVYRIGPRGGVKAFDGCCRISELTKFYGEDVRRIPQGYFKGGRWIRAVGA